MEAKENFCNNERSEELILKVQITAEYKKDTKKRHTLLGKYVISTYKKIRAVAFKEEKQLRRHERS